MRRIGIVGAQGDHPAEMLRLINDEERLPGVRVVAVAAIDGDADLPLDAPIDPALLVADVEDMVERVDAAYVATRDGTTHRTLAEPLLRAGLPVWVGAPFATTLADARAMVALARRAGTVLWSRSAMRFAPAVRRVAELAERGELRHLHLVGPADLAGPYAGAAECGAHLFEVAVEVFGAASWAQAPMAVQRTDGTVVATTRFGNIPVTCTFVSPTWEAAVPVHLIAVTDGQVHAEPLELGTDSLLPVVEQFLAAVDPAGPAQADADLLAPVHLVDSVHASTVYAVCEPAGQW